MRTERAKLHDFRVFMMQHRKITHHGVDFLSIKEAFDYGWDLGYEECMARTGYLNLMLAGVLFMVIGWGLQL